jgi:plastocyanin
MPSRSNLQRRGLLLSAIVVALATGSTLAWASAPISSSPTCCTFSAATFTIDQGELASFQNTTVTGDVHNVTAAKGGPDGRPLFFSASTPQGSTPVNGTQYLSSGSYHFVCTIHPGMEADLQVSSNGAPVARPQISLKILSTSVRKVAKSGKLKVKVTAVTASKGIDVTAKKGSKTLTKAAKLDLDAGAARTVSLGLTSSGKRALKNVNKAKVSATGTVDFGAGASAKRTLK